MQALEAIEREHGYNAVFAGRQINCVVAIEREHGYNAVFAGRQINWLVASWRQFAEPRRLKPDGT